MIPSENPPSPCGSACERLAPALPIEVPADEDEELTRADVYALLASLLLAPPDARLLQTLADRQGNADPLSQAALDQALEPLCWAATAMPADLIAHEFSALFENAGRPLIDPYGSLYTAGFMMEKPLAALRTDLAALGLARARSACEPEDHLGAVFETMRLLIAGAPGWPARPLAEQRRFFERHVAPWAERCLDDIARARPARFYRRVAGLAASFLAVETAAFELETP